MRARLLLVLSLLAALTFGGSNDPSDRFRILTPLDIQAASVNSMVMFYGAYGVQRFPRNVLSASLSSKTGQRAQAVRAILYAPGCQMMEYRANAPVQGPLDVRYECHKLPTVLLRGTISGLPRGAAGVKVVATYVALWSHSFFGVYEGPEFELKAAEAIVDIDGRFVLELPDFASDPVHATAKDQAYLDLVVEYNGRVIRLRDGKARPGMIGIPVQAGYGDALFSMR